MMIIINIIANALYPHTKWHRNIFADVAKTSPQYVQRTPAPREVNVYGIFPTKTAHAGSRTRVTSMGGLYDAATLHALMFWGLFSNLA